MQALDSMSLRPKAGAGFWLGLGLLHALVAVGFSWPLVRELDQAIPCVFHAPERPAADSFKFLWNVWWFHEAVRAGQTPFECPRLFHPLGASLYFDTLTPINGALAFPFVGRFGVVAAANLMLLLNLALGGLAASALGWRVGGRAGALVTGLAFGSAPFVFGRLMGHWNLACVAPLALGALALLRLAEKPGWRSALGLGLALGLAGYSEYTYLLFLLLLAGGMLGAALLGRGPAAEARAGFAGGLSLALGVAGLLLAPVLLGAWRVHGERGPASVVREREAGFTADLLEYLTPNLAHPLWRDSAALASVAAAVPGFGQEAKRLWPGAVVLLLAWLGLRRSAMRGLRWWGAVVVASAWLSMGGGLRIGGLSLLPEAYPLIDRIPVLGYARAPGRYAALVQLGLAVLAGAGAAELARRRGRAALGLACLGLLFEFVPAPLPLLEPRIPEPVLELARAPEPGAVWSLSVNGLESLLFQTRHGRPTVGGYYARASARDREPAAGLLLALRRSEAGAPGAEALLRDLLEAWGVRFVLLPPELDAATRGGLARRAWLRLRSEAGGWSLYEVAPLDAATRAGLAHRLLACLGRRPRLEPVIFLALRRLAPEGPIPAWSASEAELKRLRTWWLCWGSTQPR